MPMTLQERVDVWAAGHTGEQDLTISPAGQNPGRTPTANAAGAAVLPYDGAASRREAEGECPAGDLPAAYRVTHNSGWSTLVTPLPMKQTHDAAGAAATTAPTVQLLAVEEIRPDPNNRKDPDPQRLRLLADEIKADGLLQPIVVRRLQPEELTLVERETKPLPSFRIVAGERRWEAFRLLARAEIPAIVTDCADAKTATRRRCAENFHREDLSPIEKARDLAQLFKDGMTQAEVAAFVGAKDQSTVSNMMRLLKLPPRVQELLQEGALNAAHGKALLRFEPYPKVVEKIAALAVEQGASSKQLEQGLPFADRLVLAGVVHEMGYRVLALKELPPLPEHEAAKFVEARDQYADGNVYCLDPELGRRVSEKLEKEAEAKRAAAKNPGAGKRKGGGMTPAELAERKRVIEKNRKARAEIATAFTTASCALNGMVSLDDIWPAVKVVVSAALESWQHSRRITEAAKKVGFAAKDRKAVAALAPIAALRVAAMAVLMRQCDDAAKNAWEVPEAAQLLATDEKYPSGRACSTKSAKKGGRK